ncbi:MAG: HEAT repeat domain-containing protein, partial [bacterium]|nr:HEAT repeat domain-containing protein [bacterium]
VKLMVAAGGESKLHFESQLIALGDPAIDALRILLRSDADWPTLLRAVDAMGKLKAMKAIPEMCVLLGHPNAWVRIASAHALGELGAAEVVPVLVTTLGDSSDTVVAAAVIAVGKIGDRQAVGPVGKLINHPNPRVRGSAVLALGRLGGQEARELLRAKPPDEDSGVRFKTQKALQALQSQP